MSADITVRVNGDTTHRIHLRNLGAPPGQSWEEGGERLYEWTMETANGDTTHGTVTHVRSEGMLKLMSIICAAAGLNSLESLTSGYHGGGGEQRRSTPLEDHEHHP